ncbi:MAG: response regulator [Spirochaetaceae bacterium]|jgi:signal transduction histidine kinase/DNA-binding NarL/FixJ family response regulator/HPt (histidine-containing phosphotransfer) domain-containing protein|nr:response regulator [Spirochaetaceae bacterium]
MNDAQDARYQKLGNFLSIFGISVYGILWTNTLLDKGQFENAAVSVGFFAICIATILLLQRIKSLPSAFAYPFAMFIFQTAGSIITGSFIHYFLICFLISGLGAIYCNTKTQTWYLLVSNAIIGILFIFKLPCRDFTYEISFMEALFTWGIMVVGSIYFSVIASFASDKSHKADKALGSFATILETTTNWIAIVDELNLIDCISKPLARYAHVEDRELVAGRPILDLFNSMDVKLMIGELLEIHGFHVNLQTININGEARYFNIFTDKLAGNAGGLFILISDITDLVSARDEADNARRTAELANSAKSDFLATMSHEIRTPMNAILGMSDLMRTDNFDKVQLGYFEDIKKTSKSLLGIINDILDFSKIEAGKLELVPVHYNIVSLFDNVASLCGFIAAGKSLEFRSACAEDIPPILYGDEIRIRQIFINVVNNAIKYTRGGYVSFSLKKGMRGEAEYLIAAVEDTGIGIKDEDKSKLFGSFEQLDTRRNRSVTGTGLGLAITKQLLDLMGGFVELKSVYGKGSTFTLFIPLVPGDPALVEEGSAVVQFIKARAEADIQILVVDDIPINLTVALGFLARHGMNAETAEGGEEAVRMVIERGAEKRYDLVLMDHMMPEVDGVEATRRIRAWEAEQASPLRKMPIVALSANAVSGAREFFLANGMDGFISKPIVAEQLNEVLFQYLPHEKLLLSEEPAAERKPAAQQPAELLALAAVLDIAEGLKNNGGDSAMYIRTLELANRAIPKEQAKLEEERSRKDWTNFGIRAHALKGIFATIGHKALSAMGKELEFAAKEGRIADCESQAAPFIAAIQDFTARLAQFHQHEAPTESANIADADPLIVREKTAALISACEASNGQLIKSAFSELAQVCNHQSIEKIRDLIDDYDYDEAAKLLRELAETLA